MNTVRCGLRWVWLDALKRHEAFGGRRQGIVVPPLRFGAGVLLSLVPAVRR